MNYDFEGKENAITVEHLKNGEICKGSKIYSTDENDLYELDKELNKLGFKTRMGRNCDTGTLSIAVLEEPGTENI